MTWTVWVRDFQEVYTSTGMLLAVEECRQIRVDKYRTVDPDDYRIIPLRRSYPSPHRLEIRVPVAKGDPFRTKREAEAAAGQYTGQALKPQVVRTGSAEEMRLAEEARRLLRGT